MATGVNFEYGEVANLALRLASENGEIGAKGSKALRRAAASVERDSKTLCPVDTGFLKNSITTDIQNDGRFLSMSAEIGPTASYGGYVEYGTSRQSPQPYMGPAFDKAKGPFEDAIAKIGEDIA